MSVVPRAFGRIHCRAVDNGFLLEVMLPIRCVLGEEGDLDVESVSLTLVFNSIKETIDRIQAIMSSPEFTLALTGNDTPASSRPRSRSNFQN